MEIIFLETKKEYNNYYYVIQAISKLKDKFLETYEKYLDEDEIKRAVKLIKFRTYYVCNMQGEYNTKDGILNVNDNGYKFDDYKFIDTRVTYLKNNPKVCIINISNITNISDSINSLLCALMHDVLHVLSEYKYKIYLEEGDCII